METGQVIYMKQEKRPKSFYIALILGCLLLALISINIWLLVTERVEFNRYEDLKTQEDQIVKRSLEGLAGQDRASHGRSGGSHIRDNCDTVCKPVCREGPSSL